MTETFRMCDTIIHWMYKNYRKKKNKNVNNFDVIHSNGGNRFIIHSRSLWKPFVRPSLWWDTADLWLVIIMDIIHAPGKPILPRLFAYARPITFGFFLIIIIYLFCVLARWSRRSYITTTSAFFEFRNDNGLKLARFDYRYRMPE